MAKRRTQGTDEWLAQRRLGVTSTDIGPILGVSPYRSEGDVARSKTGAVEEHDAETERRFRLGRGLEPVVKIEDELEHDVRLRRVDRFIVSTEDPILRTSLDYERVGERTIVEVKTSTSRARWRDGLPEDVEAQVRWQMGVSGYPRAHVAALLYGDTLACFDVEHDEDTWRALVTIAEDFWRRVLDGGPFEETRASVSRAWPLDDGTMMTATEELDEAVNALLITRAHLADLSEKEDRLVAAIQTKMGPATALLGSGYRITWKRTKEVRETDYKALASDALGALADPIRIVELTDRHTTTRPGSRRFTVKETE